MLIVGLGNIGTEYTHTRHNIGFEALDSWVSMQNATWETKPLAAHALVEKRGVKIHCIKPTTYMNLSGKSVRYWADQLGVSSNALLVIVDELAFSLGVVKLRLQGSDGGHNGLKSIQQEIKTHQYARLRCGIGNDFPRGRQADFVLGKWKADETPIVEKMKTSVCNAIDEIVLSNMEFAMNKINKPVEEE